MSRIVKDHRPAVRFCEPRPKRVLLCRIKDTDFSPSFDDLTIRCVAVGNGKAEVFDLMFGDLDVQILESAIERMRQIAITVVEAGRPASTPFWEDGWPT